MMQDMATSLLEAENKKETIYQPISIFTNLICHLMQDKDFAITNYGKIVIRKDEHDLSVFDLSSGEKQLLILLSEPLLQRQEPFIFIADEPELSLHIEWQAEIISSIREINSLSQVIVATHSPEIAGGWAEKIIDMKDIIYG
jgi:predicted ATPase